jgi:hypothetical protein
MPPRTTPGSQTPSLDLGKSLLETFSVNEKAMLARQVGHPLPPQTGFALWEWGTLWRECGFGK